MRYRAELTRFLQEKQVDGTNDAAERALRPAVIMRKITGGNRSTDGDKTWVTLASLLRTADQQNVGVYPAMLQFLETAPEKQIDYIKRVFDADEAGSMEKLLEEAVGKEKQSPRNHS